MPKKELDQAKLRDAAYHLWLQEGQPEGRDQEHWHKAVEALTPSEPKTEPKAEPKAKAPRKAATKAPAKAAAKTTTKPAPKPKAPAKPRQPKAP